MKLKDGVALVTGTSPNIGGGIAEGLAAEGAAIVFTARYLLRRGYCCESGCRHCPYTESAEMNPGSTPSLD